MRYITIFLMFLLPIPAFAAIAFDASTDRPSETCTTGETFTHTVTGTNPFLIVGVIKSSNQDTTSVTWGGTAMTDLGTITKSAGTISLFYLAAPATGLQTISFDENSADTCAAVAWSFTGVNQTTPLDTNGSATGLFITPATAPPTKTLTTTATSTFLTDILVAVSSTVGLDANAGQTKVSSSTVSTSDVYVTSYKGPQTPGSNTSSWSPTATVNWALWVLAICPDTDLCPENAGVTVLSSIESDLIRFE